VSKRSGEIAAYVLGVIAIAGGILFFRYHQFHWWLLIIPATSIPLVVMRGRLKPYND
jgi:hypothetical protein